MKRRRHRRPDPRRQILLAALAGALVLVALAYSALTAGNRLPLKSYFYLNARFGDAAELDPYSDVRIAGKLVGQVLSTSLAGHTATARLQLDSSLRGTLRADATARIRLRGLIGAKYVDLTPGRLGPPLRSDATLPVTQTSTSVAVFDVLATFDPRRRADLRATLDALGAGFAGHGAALNIALAQAPVLAGDVGAVASAVDARTGAAARLVPGAESLTAALDPVRDVLATGWAPAARALRPLTAQRADVQAALSIAPGTLTTTRAGLARATALLGETAGLSRELTALSVPAPAALTRAEALLRAAPGPLGSIAPMLRSLQGAIPSTVRLLDGAWPLAVPLDRGLRSALAPVTELGRYSCDIARWARDYSALFALGAPPDTAIGPIGVLRGAFADNPDTLTPNTPGAVPARFYDPPCTAFRDRLP